MNCVFLESKIRVLFSVGMHKARHIPKYVHARV